MYKQSSSNVRHAGGVPMISHSSEMMIQSRRRPPRPRVAPIEREDSCDIAVVDLARDPAPLAANTNAMVAFLGKTEAANDQGGGTALHCRRCLFSERSRRFRVPRAFANKPFKVLLISVHSLGEANNGFASSGALRSRSTG